MPESENTPESLEALRAELERVKHDQTEAAKMLIRRDLALSRANDQLRSLDLAKSEFISVAAHQLRTPLSAVKWILSMLQGGEFKTDEERKEFLDKAAQSVDRMIQLVNDLLEVDHIESGKKRFVFTAVDVASVINLAVSDIMPAAEKRGVKLDVKITPSSWVAGDVEKLHAVFQNLIENAVKYTPMGGTVTVSTKQGDGLVVVNVSDTGIGIPADQQKRLFTKFFRAQNAMRVDTTGSGLGLFIVKQIVERHGGQIHFTSVEKQGTTFTVSFPQKIMDTQAAQPPAAAA